MHIRFCLATGWLKTATGEIVCHCTNRHGHSEEDHWTFIAPEDQNRGPGLARWGKIPDITTTDGFSTNRCENWFKGGVPTSVVALGSRDGLPHLHCELKSGHNGRHQRSSLRQSDGSAIVIQWD